MSIINKVGDLLNKSMGSTDKSGYSILNSHSTIFKGYGKTGNIELGNTDMLDIEDPTYLVFDINIDNSNVGNGQGSPLFDANILEFYNNYSSDMEIANAKYAYDDFLRIVKLIFPDTENKTGNSKSGTKRHYINSISGLDVLNKKILNFPDDKITIKLSEDVTMLSQYLSELYLDMSYSYATNRQLVPDNLLRFDMYIILSDVRDMKYGKLQSPTSKYGGYIDNIVDNKSRFIYQLHDCQFDFTASKIHGSEMSVAGFSTAPSNTPASMDINIIFKSYSRILVPALMMSSSVGSSYILDYKTHNFGFPDSSNRADDSTSGPYKLQKYDRTNTNAIENNNATILFDRFNRDYLNQSEYNTTTPPAKNLSGVDEEPSYNNASTKSATFLEKVGNTVKQKVKSLQSSLQNSVVNQADKLKENIQKSIANVTGINLTVDRVNVYYDTTDQKLDKLSMLASNLINRTESALQKTVTKTIENIGNTITGDNTDWNSTVSGYGKIVNADEIIGVFSGKKANDTLNDKSVYEFINNRTSDFTPNTNNEASNVYGESNVNNQLTDKNIYGESNVNNSLIDKNIYDKKPVYNQKTPSGDREEAGTYNEKYPNGSVEMLGKHNENYPEGDLMESGEHNEKYPDGSREKAGIYNEKYPSGKVEMTGVHNEKNPNGDREIDGTYNLKYPNGSVDMLGSYNEKYPTGEIQMKGEHNEKYPDGSREEIGTYNEKHPAGDVHENSTYNKKYPFGIIEDKGKYNINYPSGKVEMTGVHNNKIPTGDVHENSTYNKKYPSGEIQMKGEHNNKIPTGDVHENSTYNKKYPEGSREENGIYNIKYPSGSVDMTGKHNEKLPTGDVHEDGKHNEKFPEGDLMKSGEHNEKYPSGSREEKGEHNEKYPSGDLHENGKHNEKYPDGDVEEDGKHNEKLPENNNVYKNKK